MEDSNDFNIKNNYKNNKLKIKILILSLLFFIILYFLFSAPFKNNNVLIHVSKGESTSSIYKDLKDKNSIRNINSLKIFMKILGGNNGISSGDYLIKSGSPVWSIAWQLGHAKHGINPIKVTIREGLNNVEIADILYKNIPNFNKDEFLMKVKDKQGYLFPDTYFIFPLDQVDEIIYKLSENFEKKTSEVKDSVNKNNLKMEEVVIMASILEGEARGKDDAYIISGILWNRISTGMPLQVDVDKITYKKKGLPEFPINNPGMVSIKAAANPVLSSYFYYLHDKTGQVHFAKTYQEHKNNINKYLK